MRELCETFTSHVYKDMKIRLCRLNNAVLSLFENVFKFDCSVTVLRKNYYI
jgi:hypothetical protein